MLDTFPIIDLEASPAEHVGVVLAYRDEVCREDAFERELAAATCERHRAKIMRGNPPYAVLRRVERGVAPAWVTDALQRRYVAGDRGESALVALAA